MCDRERESEREGHSAASYVCAGDTVTQSRLVFCKHIRASSLCSPLGLELMVKLRTLLTVFIFNLKAEPHDYNNYNNNLLHLYSAFLDTQSALHSKGAISSSTTNVQHPPGWCDDSHSAPERTPHTSLLVERRQGDEANQCMGMIRRPWWSEASGLVWPGCRGNTPTLFRRTSWDFLWPQRVRTSV